MPQLDPQMEAMIARLVKLGEGLPPLPEMTPDEARAAGPRLWTPLWDEDAQPVDSIEDRTIPGPAGPMRVRVYDPGPDVRGAAATGPGLVYIHGGGWVICSIESHDTLCRRLALAGRLRVASIEYRLAPEDPFPAPLEDCVAAVRWFQEHGAEWGFDPARLAVGGDSAGGNLTLGTALALRDRGAPLPRYLALLYGAFSTDLDTPSHRAFGGGDYLLSTAEMAWFWNHYLPDAAARSNPLAVPLLADLRGLPPMLVTAAEFDPLRDDDIRLAARLAEAGQPFDFRLWTGVTHAALHMSGYVPRMARIVAQTGALISEALA